jgi:uncharacterized phage-associated protein
LTNIEIKAIIYIGSAKGGIQMTYTASTVAKFVISFCNERDISISNLKLQKLLYFAWIEYCKNMQGELYLDDICAWQLGPVIPNVYFEFCAFGGKSINRKYAVSLEENDKRFLLEYLEEYSSIPASRLVDLSHTSGGAWDIVFNGGEGNRATIPFELIEQTEC